MRALVGSRSGDLLDELDVRLSSLTWILNGIGRAKFSIATTDPKARPENLRPGNRIWIEVPGLPPWVGVIDLPRRWSGGEIEVACYGIEYILQYRLTDRSTTFDSAPVGAIFARVLREMNAAWPEGIELGQVWLGGQGHYPRYHYKSVWQVMESIRRMEQCDIVFEPVLQNGRIFFRAHLLERWGEDKSDRYAFAEGANISEITYEEQGPLVNSVVAAGAGTTWAERQAVHAEDAESIQQYGLREKMDLYADVTFTSTLEMHARARLAQSEPLRRFGLTVVDAEPALFSAYHIGDILWLEAPGVGWGYSGKVRVVGREYSGGVCKLAVDEWRPERQIFVRQEEME